MASDWVQGHFKVEKLKRWAEIKGKEEPEVGGDPRGGGSETKQRLVIKKEDVTNSITLLMVQVRWGLRTNHWIQQGRHH